MTLERIREILDAELIVAGGAERLDIQTVSSSDLMSDVLCFSKSPHLLLTGLTNPQAVRTAEVAEIRAVCFVHGKKPPQETVELAKKNGTCLLATPCSMFTASGKLYAAGLAGCNDERE
jgi:hypothetical protein